MCNRYENLCSISDIRKLAAALNRKLSTTRETDNLRQFDNIYPDQDAPVVANTGDGALVLKMARWGFPPIPGQRAPITNIRNLNSRWWRDVNKEWITSSEYRCLVPFTAFAEPIQAPRWFVVPGVEVGYFAGVWRPWHGERLVEQPGQKRRSREERAWELYAFLTTEPNDVVRPVHDKSMPVILIDPAEQGEWLGGGKESLRLQRPLPNAQLEMREDIGGHSPPMIA